MEWVRGLEAILERDGLEWLLVMTEVVDYGSNNVHGIDE